jgi:hypothetical protein
MHSDVKHENGMGDAFCVRGRYQEGKEPASGLVAGVLWFLKVSCHFLGPPLLRPPSFPLSIQPVMHNLAVCSLSLPDDRLGVACHPVTWSSLFSGTRRRTGSKEPA